MAQFNFNPLQTVQPSAAPTPSFGQRASADAFGAQQFRALEGAAAAQAKQGAALEGLSNMASEHAMQMQAVQNETDVYDAYNKHLDPTVREQSAAFYALEGKPAVDALKPATENLEKALQSTRDSLSNPVQQRMFDKLATQRIASENYRMTIHAQDQNKVYQDQTSAGLLKNNQEDAISVFNNPDAYNHFVDSGISEIKSYWGGTKGVPPEVVKQKVDDYISGTKVKQIERVAVDDPLGAQALYKQDMDKVLPSDRAQVEKFLNQAVIPVVTRNVATRVMQGGSQPNPDAANSVVKGGLPYDVIAMAESGGKDYNRDGSVVTSSKGARGSMQVMPKTGADPGFGVRPSDGSVADDARMGRDYYAAMLARYGGDQSLALAAYNAGPGVVDKAIIKMGARPGDMVDSGKVILKMPAETQEYVAKINAQAPPEPGKPPTATDIRLHQGEWETQTREVLTQMYPNKPEVADMGAARVSQRAAEISHADALHQQENRATLTMSAMGWVRSPDGSFSNVPNAQRPTSIDALLSTPDLRRAFAESDSITQSAILAKVTQNAQRKDPVETLASMQEYHRLNGMFLTNPGEFAMQDLLTSKMVDSMPNSYLQSLLNKQDSLLKGNEAKKADINAALSDAGVQQVMSSANVPLTHSKTGKTSGDERRYQFIGALGVAIDKYKAENKKPPGIDETRALAREVATPVVTGPGFLWGNRTSLKFQVEVPEKEAAKINDAFRKRLGKDATPEQVRAAYATILEKRAPK